MNPDLGPYCLQRRLSKYIKQIREQATIVVNGGKRLNTIGGLVVSEVLSQFKTK